MRNLFDIFISYRKKVSGDKPELLWQILEHSGYKSRVSFDKDNLAGKFNVELLRRIDSCKDFVLLVFPDTFNECDPHNHLTSTFYHELALLPIEKFVEEVKKLEQLTKEELTKKINWTGDIQNVHIDYLRIEINRALNRADKGELNIIPLTFLRSEKYSFSNLNLPNDLKPLKEFQAIFYSNSEEERFNRIIPDLKKRLKSIPNNNLWREILTILIVILLLVFGYLMYNRYVYQKSVERDFAKCKTLFDYEKFKGTYPNTKLASQCQDSMCLMRELKNDGRAYVNNVGVGFVKESLKQEYTIDCIEWNHNITLLQLRIIKDILNRMMFVKAKNITFAMGREDSVSYDSPIHRVSFSRDFYICQYEITREWYYAIMNDSIVTTNKRHPISNVTWNDAMVFIDELKRLTRLSFNIPTEAQWEWAATHGLDYAYSGGNDARAVAWYNVTADGILHDVGRKNANLNELYDMSGNVSEWCLDDMGRYKDVPQIDPIIIGNISSDGKVIRGGSIFTNERDLNVRHRSVQSQSESGENIGFRIVLLID